MAAVTKSKNARLGPYKVLEMHFLSYKQVVYTLAFQMGFERKTVNGLISWSDKGLELTVNIYNNFQL